MCESPLRVPDTSGKNRLSIHIRPLLSNFERH
ncbi:hypothetical protein GcM1_230055 [Golovinomyces cichoracearum]|uniref:Uncharacterized protein n=1 Tax=Golovinomyces cichoracearum TaxID=62708 RepID=A0A420INE8_9PEZI|nr:hypothetical protein GcM1_230055 [Golovinomyces cichoracearum]